MACAMSEKNLIPHEGREIEAGSGATEESEDDGEIPNPTSKAGGVRGGVRGMKASRPSASTLLEPRSVSTRTIAGECRFWPNSRLIQCRSRRYQRSR